MNQIGISLYASSGLEKNLRIISKAKEVGATYVFTSLHIPEEDYTKSYNDILQTLQACKDANINVFVDISKETLEMLQIKDIHDLKKLGITSLRFDDGFTPEEIVALSSHFQVVVNASTFNEQMYHTFKSLHADFSNWIGCHNYYPKPYTGLSKEFVKETNARLHSYGMQVMGFVPGDEARGPLYEKLPMIEDQRHQDFLYNLLETYNTNCDITLVSDIDITDDHYAQLSNFQKGFIELKVQIDPTYSCFLNMLHHDRIDASPYFIRSIESRTKVKLTNILPSTTIERTKGSICLSNNNYLRYRGEMEIARCDVEKDERVNVIGKVLDTLYLDILPRGFGYILVV